MIETLNKCVFLFAEKRYEITKDVSRFNNFVRFFSDWLWTREAKSRID